MLFFVRHLRPFLCAFLAARQTAGDGEAAGRSAGSTEGAEAAVGGETEGS